MRSLLLVKWAVAKSPGHRFGRWTFQMEMDATRCDAQSTVAFHGLSPWDDMRSHPHDLTDSELQR